MSPAHATRPLLLTALFTLLTGAAHAHEGHGLSGAHWHATDVLGFIGLALAIGLALWFTRK